LGEQEEENLENLDCQPKLYIVAGSDLQNNLALILSDVLKKYDVSLLTNSTKWQPLQYGRMMKKKSHFV